MSKIQLPSHFWSIISDIKTYGVLNQDAMLELMEGLELPDGFPAFQLDYRDESDRSWTRVSAAVKIDVHSNASATLMSSLHSQAMSFVLGKTEGFEGLEKSTVWPSAFLLSNQIKVRSEGSEGVVSFFETDMWLKAMWVTPC